MSKHPIRVSDWAHVELKRRAAIEGRSVVSVVDRLLGRPRPDAEALSGPPTADDVARGRRVVKDGAEYIAVGPASVAVSCPKCGCAASVHEAGDSRARCERHPSCRWDRA